MLTWYFFVSNALSVVGFELNIFSDKELMSDVFTLLPKRIIHLGSSRWFTNRGVARLCLSIADGIVCVSTLRITRILWDFLNVLVRLVSLYLIAPVCFKARYVIAVPHVPLCMNVLLYPSPVVYLEGALPAVICAACWHPGQPVFTVLIGRKSIAHLFYVFGRDRVRFIIVNNLVQRCFGFRCYYAA